MESKQSVELSVRNLSKIYGISKWRAGKAITAIPALTDFSYTFTPGIYGLLGPNGAGKSTLMNIITCNLPQTSGEMFYNEMPIDTMKDRYRGVLGYMPQQHGLYDSFTLLRFMRYMAALKGLPARESDEQIHDILKRVNLQQEAKQRLGSFSGGMKQRALFAQALLGSPKLLILDEPTAGLDPNERIRLRNLVAEFALDRIVIFATHVVSDVESIAKEILFLKKGHLVRSGSPYTLCSEINGRVSKMTVQPQEVPAMLLKHRVIEVVPVSEGMSIRILGRAEEIGSNAQPVSPQLEDVYLMLFGEETV